MLNLSLEERKARIQNLQRDVNEGRLSIGDTIKRIRVDLYGMTQTRYAQFVQVSDKTLREIEKGNTDPRLSIVSRLLSPGGFKLSCVFDTRI